VGSGFLPARTGRPWRYNKAENEFEYYQGRGPSQLEVVVVEYGEKPNKDALRQMYSDRRGNRANPILIVALYTDKAGLCGPSGEDPPIFRDVDRGQAERVCDAALDKPDRFAAEQFLSAILPQLDNELPGIRNQGLLSTHELQVGVPDREDWRTASERAQAALAGDSRELINGLNYEIDRLTDQSYVLKDTDSNHERAVAVFLEDDES